MPSRWNRAPRSDEPVLLDAAPPHLLMLVIATVLFVYKPWGKIWFGRREAVQPGTARAILPASDRAPESRGDQSVGAAQGDGATSCADDVCGDRHPNRDTAAVPSTSSLRPGTATTGRRRFPRGGWLVGPPLGLVFLSDPSSVALEPAPAVPCRRSARPRRSRATDRPSSSRNCTGPGRCSQPPASPAASRPVKGWLQGAGRPRG